MLQEYSHHTFLRERERVSGSIPLLFKESKACRIDQTSSVLMISCRMIKMYE